MTGEFESKLKRGFVPATGRWMGRTSFLDELFRLVPYEKRIDALSYMMKNHKEGKTKLTPYEIDLIINLQDCDKPVGKSIEESCNRMHCYGVLIKTDNILSCPVCGWNEAK